MGYASKAGRAWANPTNPQAQAVCDRCGFWYRRVDLHNQYEWRGAALMPTYIYVCDQCYDVPSEQLRAIVIPADPMPIVQPRVEPFLADEMQGAYEPAQPYGQPVGLAQAAIPPLVGNVQYGVELPILSASSTGTTTVTITCSAPHGLTTNDQISAAGLSRAGFRGRNANGFYSVTVISATAFTYETAAVVTAGNLLTTTTRIVTCLIGLPLGLTTIPQIPA